MNRFFYKLLFLLLAVRGFAAAPAELLPSAFNGWQLEKPSLKQGADAAAIDAADSPVLTEYGFSDYQTGSFERGGRKMQVKVARFNDATGAYGAFTFYVQPQMQTEKIGDQGVSNNSRVLFYKGNLLVDISLDQITAMSAADLRALADALPRPKGNISALPVLPSNLPKQGYLPHTARFVVGPVALGRLGVPVPADLVDFSKGPEVAFGKYRTSEGEANLTLVSYPTPQIAIERVKSFEGAGLQGFYFRRTGPIVVALNGSIPKSEAESLLASINYDADVTWNQPTKIKPEDRAGFVVALVLLCSIAVLGALVFGFAFGGIRLLVDKFYPNRVFNRPESVDFIRLDLK